MKKSIIALLLLLVMALPLAVLAEEAYNDVPYKTVELPETDPNYYKELAIAELYNWKQIRNYPTLYTNDTWKAYLAASGNLQGYDFDALTDAQKEELLNVKAAREALVQIRPFMDGLNGEVIYIWGDDMPVTTPAEELVFRQEDHDEADYRPFLTPYLVEDQSQAKGIVLVTSGGGNNFRSNAVEAYYVCPAFVEQGYNAFLLQRRVYPYNNDDIVMDMQRAIRFIKYHAEEWGLGGTDIFVSSGFSGSGGNLRVLLEKFYGDITPDQFDTDYVCDEIDAVNSDIDVAIFIYSGSPLQTDDNPNIPHIFIGVGEDDSYAGSIALFEQLKGDDERFSNVNPELHIYGQNGHGFGAGTAGTSSELWIPSADLYIQKVMGKNETIVAGDPPERFVLWQLVEYTSNNMGIPVMVYTTADHSEYYYSYNIRNTDSIVYGKIIGNTPVVPDYDSSGGFAAKYNSHTDIWALTDPTAWQPREE